MSGRCGGKHIFTNIHTMLKKYQWAKIQEFKYTISKTSQTESIINFKEFWTMNVTNWPRLKRKHSLTLGI